MLTSFDQKVNETTQKVLTDQQQERSSSSARVSAANYPLGAEREDAHTEIDTAVTYLDGLSGLYDEYAQLQERANVVLYEFLQGVFYVVARMKIPTAARKGKALADMRLSFEVTLKQLKKNEQISFTKATSFEAKVLRFVCGKISPSREKAWVRVLKIALNCDEVTSGKVPFAAWLAREGGIYEVAHTSKDGVKPSERDNADIADALTLIEGGWLNTEEHRHLVDEVAPTARAKDDKYNGLMVTLTYHEQGAAPQKVIELHDDIAIERVLVLMGRQMKQPMRKRADVLAEEAERMQVYTSITGFEPEMHRDHDYA